VERTLAQALNRVRPFALRRLMMFRPPRLLMRTRNPWVRLRLLRFGWYVRFIDGPPWSERTECGPPKKQAEV